MIRLFWYSRPHLKRDNVNNFGDVLSERIVSKISGETVVWIDPLAQRWFDKIFRTHVLAIGSILHFGASNSRIWGSGLIDTNSAAPNAKYFAVRGPHTRNELLKRGYKVPDIYGDPGLLTPLYYEREDTDTKYTLGVIPHYVEVDMVKSWAATNGLSSEVLVIDLRKKVEVVLKEIISCQKIISSSLHGIIVPQAFDIPTLRVRFSNSIYGDGIKYKDYFDSVGIDEYKFPEIDKNKFYEYDLLEYFSGNEKFSRIKNDLSKIQNVLLANRPF